MRAPEFWRRRGPVSTALLPAAWAYDALGRRRRARTAPVSAGLPVICIGNLVTGGAGKTPLTLALVALLQEQGYPPGILTRGYGGALAGPVLVELARHSCHEIGDEALLLAAAAPCIVARDRIAGAKLAAATGARVLLMDDGLQNPSLVQDLKLIAIDGGYGFGNGRVLPAGPLRESLGRGLGRIQGAVLIGGDRFGIERQIGGRIPVAHAALVPGDTAKTWVGQRVLAFAGIGRPQKFFETLASLGAVLAGTRDFPDHHPYRPAEIEALLAEAKRLDAAAVTTTKDRVRLPQPYRDRIETLDVNLAWTSDADRRIVQRLIASILQPPVTSP
jgi:tetraacyldisaccharide 4'-kinase